MAPKGTRFEPKGHQHEPKGCQRGAKSEPEINKNTAKDRCVEKGRKRRVPCTKFWNHFCFFDEHASKKQCEKHDRKTRQKKEKLNNFKEKKHVMVSKFPSSKEDKTLTSGNFNKLGLNHLIKGGYNKVNLKISNKKSYKPLYDISGKEYNSLIQQLQKGGSNNISLYKSNTYSNMKDQVICSITGQILDNNKKLL